MVIKMDKNDVIKLMRSSKSEKEWNENCDKVKEEFFGYPDWWYETIILGSSGRLSMDSVINQARREFNW